MSWVTTGADVGTMLTGLSAVTATILWGRSRIRDWRDERAARVERNWNGYIIREYIPSWFVRVIEDGSANNTERVVLDVINKDGTPNANMAHQLKLYIRGGGTLTNPPSAAQWDFLQDLRLARFGAPSGYPIY
jgi:hypothetical protein